MRYDGPCKVCGRPAGFNWAGPMNPMAERLIKELMPHLTCTWCIDIIEKRRKLEDSIWQLVAVLRGQPTSEQLARIREKMTLATKAWCLNEAKQHGSRALYWDSNFVDAIVEQPKMTAKFLVGTRQFIRDQCKAEPPVQEEFEQKETRMIV